MPRSGSINRKNSQLYKIVIHFRPFEYIIIIVFKTEGDTKLPWCIFYFVRF